MKIYTKSGDKGKTTLFGGKIVDKNSERTEAYGNVDELNALIGVTITDLIGIKSLNGIKKKLLRIQRELFILGSDLAAPLNIKAKVPRVTKPSITRLEKEVDIWQKSLPQIKKFILPGGRKVGARLHLARAVVRRCERSIVNLSNQEKINDRALTYINRLSDWFFVAARYVNKLENVHEIKWKGRGK